MTFDLDRIEKAADVSMLVGDWFRCFGGHEDAEAVAALVEVLRAAQQLVADEESQPGGWGPDVTMLYPLREALRAFGDEQSSSSGGGS